MAVGERILNFIGYKRPITVVEIDQAESKLRELTVGCMQGKIDLLTYRTESDKLPGIDLRALAQELHFKG